MKKIHAAQDHSTRASQSKQEPNGPVGLKQAGAGPIGMTQPPGGTGQILHLQNMVGNRAVQRLLHAHDRSAQDSGTLIQRWGGDEHFDIGQAAGIQIDLGNGVILDWGEVVGIGGDELGSPEEILEMTKTESGKARIRAALEHAEIVGNGVKTLPAPTDDEKNAQSVEFYTLLLDNVTHFQSDGKALDTYRGYHIKALNEAASAGIQHPTDTAADLNPAYFQEAFGQHFLTDMFSSGHAITPRNDIWAYYVNVWAPKMVDAILGNIKARLVNGIFEQVAAQSGFADIHPGYVRGKIESALTDMLNEAIGQLKGGKDELTTYLGKGVAGVISGAIHDYYNVKGLQFSSVNHPEMWVAYGDGHLNDDADQTNKEQAQLAVQAGLAELQTAFEIGQREGRLKQRFKKPVTVPDRVYFPFDSDAIVGSAPEALEDAAAYLAYSPDSSLALTGHTDPIGTDTFNDGLGQRRADAAANKITEHAIPPARVSTSSQGEKSLVTSDPRKYNLNRRVEFNWKYPDLGFPTILMYDDNAIATQRVAEAIQNQIGPPFPYVEHFIPTAVPDPTDPVPDWHWEAQSSRTLEMIDVWVKKRFDQELKDKILSSPLLAKREIQGFNIDPKSIVQVWLEEIDENPTAFLNSLFFNPNDPNVFILPSNFAIPP